nr:9124_t:CDS:2 [Entrophospora candida]
MKIETNEKSEKLIDYFALYFVDNNNDKKFREINNQNDSSTLPLINNSHQPKFLPSQQTFSNYQSIAAATNIVNNTAKVDTTTTIVAGDVNNMGPLVSTPLLNNIPYDNNNNIVWLLTRLEKRIDQMEQNRKNSNQTIFGSNNLCNEISNNDIYNLLGKLFTRVERLENSQNNVERNLAELNKFCFNHFQ